MSWGNGANPSGEDRLLFSLSTPFFYLRSNLFNLFGEVGRCFLLECGKKTADALLREASLPRSADGFKSALRLLSKHGYGSFSIRTLAWENAEAEITCSDGLEAQLSLRHGISPEECNCHFTRGLLSAAFEGTTRQPKPPEIYCVETRCVTTGDPLCEFILTPDFQKVQLADVGFTPAQLAQSVTRIADAFIGVPSLRPSMLKIVNPAELREKFLKELISVAGADSGSLMRVDLSTGLLSIESGVGLPPEALNDKPKKIGEKIAGWVAQKGIPQVLITSKMKEHPEFKELTLRERIKCSACIPLRYADKVRAVLNINRQRISRPFTKLEVNYLRLLGNEFLAAMFDIREKQELRMELEKLKRSLAAVQSKRIRELQSERMVTIDELVNNVAHELRNPLTIIGAAAQLCLKRYTLDDPSFKDALEVIRKNADAAERLLRDLTSISAPTRMEFRPCPVREVVESSIALVKIECERHEIEISYEEVGKCPPLMMDRNRMQQVFINLFLNAAQAMPRGGKITIRTLWNEESSEAEIHVEDTGPGVPPSHLSKIFTPFFSTKRGGTGLGLTICAKTIQRHGGTIFAENIPSGGLRFIIRLPEKL